MEHEAPSHETPSDAACAICGDHLAPRDERAVDVVGNVVHRACLDEVVEPTD